MVSMLLGVYSFPRRRRERLHQMHQTRQLAIQMPMFFQM